MGRAAHFQPPPAFPFTISDAHAHEILRRSMGKSRADFGGAAVPPTMSCAGLGTHQDDYYSTPAFAERRMDGGFLTRTPVAMGHVGLHPEPRKMARSLNAGNDENTVKLGLRQFSASMPQSGWGEQLRPDVYRLVGHQHRHPRPVTESTHVRPVQLMQMPPQERPATIPNLVGSRQRRRRVHTGARGGCYGSAGPSKPRSAGVKLHHTIPCYQIHREVPPPLLGPTLNTALDVQSAGTTQFPEYPPGCCGGVDPKERSVLVANEKLCRKQAKTACGATGSAWTLLPTNLAIEIKVKSIQDSAPRNADPDCETNKWLCDAVSTATNNLTRYAAGPSALPFNTATMQYGRGMFAPPKSPQNEQ